MMETVMQPLRLRGRSPAMGRESGRSGPVSQAGPGPVSQAGPVP
jgi:hypothetical protein